MARTRATRFYGKPASERRQELYKFDQDIYASPEVLGATLELFNGKCAYCDGVPSQAQPLAVHHFRPTGGALDLDGHYSSDHYWWLAYEWDNLFPVCPDCAQRKGARFPVSGSRARPRQKGRSLEQERTLLLDPCSPDPELHLVYSEDGFVSSGTESGRTTIEVLALNRRWLVSARADALRAARQEWERVREALGPNEQPDHQAIQQIVSPVHPYAGIRRQFIRSRLAQLDAPPETVSALNEATAGNTPLIDPRQELLTREVFTEFEEDAKSYSLAADSPRDSAYFMTMRMIRRVELQNFRIIHELAIDFPEARNAGAAWLMLLGENGSGKSTILQAVTLALMGDQYRDGLGIDPRPLIHHGEQSASVKVYLTGASDPVELRFDRDSPTFVGTPAEPKVLLMAYGATRLLPRRDTAGANVVQRVGTRFANVDNLFNPFDALNDPASWLMNVDEAQFDALARALKRLLPLAAADRFIRAASGIEIEASGSRLKLEQLSDGFQSVLALATDMMQVLVHRWPVMEAAEGIVVIDELEAHLHPSWRMRIVSSLREIFPRLQFLASTHDPLCLRGLEDGEVVVVRRRPDNSVFAITDLPSVKGLRVDQLLTSEIFGLDSTSDPEIDDLLTEYRELRWYGDNSQDTKRREATVRQRLDKLQVLGRDRRERLLLEAADEYLATEPVIDNQSTRRQLKAQTKRRIAELFEEAVTPGGDMER